MSARICRFKCRSRLTTDARSLIWHLHNTSLFVVGTRRPCKHSSSGPNSSKGARTNGGNTIASMKPSSSWDDAFWYIHVTTTYGSVWLLHEGRDRRQNMSLLRTNGEWPIESESNNQPVSRCQNVNDYPAYQTLAQVPKRIRFPRHAQCQMVLVDYR